MRVTGKLAKEIEKKLGLPPRPKIKAPDRTQEFFQLCEHHGILNPETEYHFAKPERQWRFDFYWRGANLAVEIDGGQFGRGKPCPTCNRRAVGAHSSIGQMIAEQDKMNEAQVRGYRVLHFRPDQVYKTGEAFAVIKRALKGT